MNRLPNLARLSLTIEAGKRSRKEDDDTLEWKPLKAVRGIGYPYAPPEALRPSLEALPDEVLALILQTEKNILSPQLLTSLCSISKEFKKLCDTSHLLFKWQCDLRGWTNERRLKAYFQVSNLLGGKQGFQQQMDDAAEFGEIKPLFEDEDRLQHFAKKGFFSEIPNKDFNFESNNARDWKLFWKWGCVRVMSQDDFENALEDMKDRYYPKFFPFGEIYWQFHPAYGYMDQWDTSKVTNLRKLFDVLSYMNTSIFDDYDLISSGIEFWNVSSVTDMSFLFTVRGTEELPDLSGWDTSNVTDMSYMFAGEYEWRMPTGLEFWDTSKVTDMQGMFKNRRQYDDRSSGIGYWDVSNVTDMSYMFEGTDFNENIGYWDTSNVVNMNEMFEGNEAFNYDIGAWNTSNVDNMDDMFYGSAYDKDLSAWDLSNLDIYKEEYHEEIQAEYIDSEYNRIFQSVQPAHRPANLVDPADEGKRREAVQKRALLYSQAKEKRAEMRAELRARRR